MDIPVAFSDRQVRATLNGTMTQFRRLLRVQPELPMLWYPTPVSKRSLAYDGEAHFRKGAPADFAPWKVGDRLWVRETWAMSQKLLQGDAHPWHRHVIWAASHGARPDTSQGWEARWRPSIHMPRWASRLSLEVTEVRVQRLQDISEEDAQAEGVVPPDVHAAMTRVLENPADNGAFHRKAFRAVWDSLDPGGWDRNPWVWAVSFRRAQG